MSVTAARMRGIGETHRSRHQERMTRAERRKGIAAPVSRNMLWAGRIVSALPVLFLLLDGVGKLIKPAPVVEATVRLGYLESVIFGLGIVLVACVAVYLIPRTSILGAILLTGYLGGAVATHVRIGDPLLSHVLFPVYVGVLVWGGLYLRNGRLRALLSLRT